MPSVIRVRDVVRGATYELDPDEPILLVPYDLFQPIGSVRKRGALIDWLEGNVIQSGRFVSSKLGEVDVGVRVLIRLTPRASEDDEWWLCEIEEIDGVRGNVSETKGARERRHDERPR